MKNDLSTATIFLGSFLVFGVQPMVGRTILPVFGGTAAVWVVCLCAFQVLLLAGYFYADRLRASKGRSFHPWLLIVSAVLTALVALGRDRILSLISTGIPAIDVLICVVMLTGVSYVLLSANSSLVQAITGGEDVYKLYAVSNLGSLVGLLAYPFIFEPFVALTTQWVGFSVGIVIYAFLLRKLLASQSNSNNKDSIASVSSRAEPSQVGCLLRSSIWYLLLPAASCFVLNALTAHVTLDLMPLPLIWTASLALFLLSYILGFSGLADKIVKPAGYVAIAFLVVVCWMNGKPLPTIGLSTALFVYAGFFLASCTFLHSWLYRIRPSETKLTKYYLLQALGGALGGSIASLAFPLLSKTIVEYPIALVLVGLLVLIAFAGQKDFKSSFRYTARLCVTSLIAILAFYFYWSACGKGQRPCVCKARGFFGTIEVAESEARTARGVGYIHEFSHGSTVHGIQALIPGKEKMPTVYYTPNACGYAIIGHPKYRRGEPMRVNLVGMGVGVLFSYGRAKDYYRAYEISQDVIDVATNTNLFTFISECPAQKDVVLGDARKGLEAELAAGVEPYDVIVVDAFTGDNIPYHLSSVEAFELYFKLLKPDGILCVNISNWHLSLEPFMAALGDYFQCPLLGLATDDDYSRLQFAAKVAVFCRDPSKMVNPPFGNAPTQARMIDFSSVVPMKSLPTDEKGSFISLLNDR